jgi:tetratricopeptide (TPR) repeat protein
MFNHGHKGGFMHGFRKPSLALATVVTLSTLAAGCSQMGEIQAKRAIKVANQAYARQDYTEAADLYEEAVQADPELGYAYFYLANSLENQWKPSRKGDAANDALLTKAVENYQIAADKLANAPEPEFRLIGRRALEFLSQVYGTDKLNDPAKAEPVIQRLIQMDPGDPAAYFQLARLYEDAGAYAEAEQMYQNAKNVNPKDAIVYQQLANYYNRQGQFDKTIEALEQRAALEPNNPEAFQTISAYYWDETSRDVRLTDAEKRAYLEKGIQAGDQALKLKPDYVDALTYKGLLLRQLALVEKDPAKQQQLIKDATVLADKANELRRKQTAGAAPAP